MPPIQLGNSASIMLRERSSRQKKFNCNPFVFIFEGRRSVFILAMALSTALFYTRLIAPPCGSFNFNTSNGSTEHDVNSATKLTTYKEVDAITNQLLGPDEYGAGCPKDCGCPHLKKDCPRHYDISLVERSAIVVLDKDAIKHYETKLEAMHLVAARQCGVEKGLETGGWCLAHAGGNKGNLELPDGRKIRIPNGHVPASKNIVETLLGKA